MSGIIPAYAGSTAACDSASARFRDHPRIRGEHFRMAIASDLVTGSSPHTRGARQGERRIQACRGIIPAYAGSTRGPVERRFKLRDHPRIRGEHDGKVHIAKRARGSSPHTRGAHRHASPRRDDGGIIPAYAGSTRSSSSTGSYPRDHPRIRGEHAVIFVTKHFLSGSSPHTRGALAEHGFVFA